MSGGSPMPLLLPAGSELPPPPYLVGLLVAAAGVALLLRDRRPTVRDREVVALAPWMVVGAALHVLYVRDAAPAAAAPLLGTPAVYVVTFAVAGGVWWVLATLAPGRALHRALGLAGAVALAPVLGLVVATADGIHLLWPAVGLAVAAGLTVVARWALWRLVPSAVLVTGRAGTLVLAGHALDAVSTAIGVDVLGFGERTPLSRALIDLGAALPTADLLGAAWPFVLIKLAVAGAVVWVFADLVRETPSRGYLLLAVVAAVGLGPGAHNLLLYAVR